MKIRSRGVDGRDGKFQGIKNESGLLIIEPIILPILQKI